MRQFSSQRVYQARSFDVWYRCLDSCRKRKLRSARAGAQLQQFGIAQIVADGSSFRSSSIAIKNGLGRAQLICSTMTCHGPSSAGGWQTVEEPPFCSCEFER